MCLNDRLGICDLESPSDWTKGVPIEILNLKDRTAVKMRKNCHLKSFPSDLFDQYPFLTEAEFDCDIESLARSDFASATNLTLLKMRRNNFRRIEGRTFELLSNMNTLLLESNGLQELEEFAFAGMPLLSKLVLADNALTSLKVNNFAGINLLEELYLGNNNISQIEAGAFDLTHLEILDLENNKLTTLPGLLFQHTRWLKELILEENSFNDIPPAVYMLSTSLIELNIDRNKLSEFRLESLMRFTNLKIASILSNDITLPDYLLGSKIAVNSKLSQIYLLGRDLSEKVLKHLSVFRNLEEIRIGAHDPIWIERLEGIRDIREMFPKLKELVFLTSISQCGWLRSHFYFAKVEEIEMPIIRGSIYYRCTLTLP